MAIKSAGTFLKISEIASEFNDPAPHQMSEFHRGAGRVDDVATNSSVPTSGAVKVGDFYGCGNAVIASCPAGNNTDVAPLFPGTYTNAATKILTIAAPISLTGSNAAALTVPSNMAGTLDIQNAGTIVGSSGTIGLGANAGAAAAPGNAAGAGGVSLSIQANGVTINNSGTISGGGGGGGGGSGGVNSSTSNTVNFGGGSGWTQVVSGSTVSNNSVSVPAAGLTWNGGTANTTQLNTANGNAKNPATVNRGNPISTGPNLNQPKTWNHGGGYYTETSTTPGQVGGAGGRGYGFDGSSVISAQNGVASPGNGGAGGNGGAAGTAGSAGGTTPLGAGASAGAAGNSVTSPGSVNYTVSNSGTINGTQG
mgnify:CR=1 FL=1|tara:strand:+ start:1012 stop:2109 length:1098 start_codon:yes stop_codon:yes gene_type:complete